MGKKTKTDPTGQQSNRDRATRHLVTRLNKAQRSVMALFRDISKTRSRKVKIQNAETTVVYSYDFDEQQQEQFERSTEFILNNELLETQTDLMPLDWYYKPDIEQPYREGTLEEVRDFNSLVVGAIAAGVTVRGLTPRTVEVEQVIFSEPYRQRLATAQVTNFQSIKSLSQDTASKVIRQVNAGARAGRTPTFIAEAISKRFDVAKSSAKRIAVTSINEAYNNAKLDSVKILSEQTGLRAGVLHISALLPTTREEHAARHGNAYTVDDQLQWWNQGANRINCHCSTTTVLLDAKGNVINSKLQKEIKEERSFFKT